MHRLLSRGSPVLRLDAVLDADKAYKTFAGSSEGMDSKVKFIMETGAIEAKEE